MYACRSLGEKISKRQLAKLFESFPWREENGSWDKLQVPPPVEPNAYVNDAKVKCAKVALCVLGSTHCVPLLTSSSFSSSRCLGRVLNYNAKKEFVVYVPCINQHTHFDLMGYKTFQI